MTTASRRSKPSLFAKLRAFWVVALGLACALAGTFAYALNWPGFRLGALDVTGNALVPRPAIISRASLEPGRNIWLLDTHAAQQRIEAIPYVQSAHVQRAFPNAVEISIVERAPLGCLIAAGGAALTIDAQRRVLERGCARMPRPLLRAEALAAGAPGVFLRSEQLARLQTDAAVLRGARDAFVAFGFDRYGGLEASLAGGPLIRFGGDADLPEKLRLLDAIQARLGPDPNLLAIDLRAPAAPVLQRREPQHIQDSKPRHHNI